MPVPANWKASLKRSSLSRMLASWSCFWSLISVQVPTQCVIGAFKTIFDLEAVAGAQGGGPVIDSSLQIVRMQHDLPAPVPCLLESKPRVFEPALVVVIEIPVRLCSPDDLRQRIRQELVPALAFLDGEFGDLLLGFQC